MKNYLIISGVIFLTLTLLLFGAMFAGHYFFSSRAEKEISSIFKIVTVHYHEEVNLQNFQLPDKLMKYMIKTGINKSKPNSAVMIAHEGESRKISSQKWKRSYGNFFVRTEPPGFVWFGTIKTSMLSFSKYMEELSDNNSHSEEALFSLITTNELKGEQSERIALIRYYSLAPLYPQLLLPSRYFRWTSSDSISALAEISYNKIKDRIQFFFNNENKIIRSVNRFGTTTYNDYTVMNSRLTPSQITTDWKVPNPDFRNFNYRIKSIKWH